MGVRRAGIWWATLAVLLAAGSVSAEALSSEALDGAGAPTTAAPTTMLELLLERIESQERRLDAQEALIQIQQMQLDAQDAVLEGKRGMGVGGGDERVSGPVGTPPEPTPPPEVPILADQGGVLTPRGVLTLEPEIEFVSASTLQFEFSGIGIENALLIGDIEASSSDRQVLTSRLQARLGVMDRLEVSLDVPYLSRSDRFERRIVSAGDPGGLTDRTRGSGLGDIAVGLHYQFRRPADSRTTIVSNLRIKTRTGTSPFDADVDPAGVEQELATGSGFWSIEPSLTWIHPTDPAVLFGTLSYTWNLPQDVGRSRVLGGQPVRVGRVDPGDAIGVGFGIGISLNETTSLSLSYSHQYVLETESELNGTDFLSRPIHVGELQLGFSFELGRTPVRITAGIGVTENAPDVSVSLGIPVSFSVFD